MELTELLEQLCEVYEGNDTPCEFGCSQTALSAMIASAKELYPQRPYCVIADWVWVDIDLPPERRDQLKEYGLYPSFVRADKVLDDEVRRPHISSSVKSTALVAFHQNAIFVTRNTSYILCGQGSRVSISPETFSAVQSW